MQLQPCDFCKFQTAVHDYEPFDWQQRLLEKIVADRRWPDILDLPTGTGKTSCIDIALFALALDARAPADERWCPRRIVMVVDRRIVVDQAAERGHKIAKALRESQDPIVRAVADALAELSGEEETGVGVFTLRGGIPKDDGWARTPDRPLIIASTVDQVGSRLLFQGYGVSQSMRPLHAGLLGNDTLILLDEVHLSQPFEQTLRALVHLRSRQRATTLPHRFQVVSLSATPSKSSHSFFRLDKSDKAKETLLGRRLHAKKPARIIKVKGRDELRDGLVTEANALTERHDTILVVSNRVATAAEVARELASKTEEATRVVLLTGRMRPLDRGEVISTIRERIAAGRKRNEADSKLIVVATQCVEAGADFDFDAIVTESASLDALRQRFGRVDRLGDYGKAEGVIIHDRGEKDDPIYEGSIAATISWLEGLKQKKLDFGCLSLDGAPPEASAPKPNAPTLLPAYLDLWCQTSPRPALVPDVELFLHGPRSGPEDVQIVWRVDLAEDWFRPGYRSDEGSSSLATMVTDIVAAIPPSALEAVSLPFATAKRWLCGKHEAHGLAADVEMKEQPVTGAETREGPLPLVLIWRGDESEIIDPRALKPGDTVVLPAARGGIDPSTKAFDPSSDAIVTDRAEQAALFARGKRLLRLYPSVLSGLGLTPLSEDLDPSEIIEELESRRPQSPRWVKTLLEGIGPGSRLSTLLEPGARVRRVIAGRKLNVNERGMLLDEGALVEEGQDESSDASDSPHIGVAVELDRHSKDVATVARKFAERLGLPPDLIAALELAARLHDIGKADRRFQILLRGGSEAAYHRDRQSLLAKSAMSRQSRAERRVARAKSGYPPGMRHEIQAVAMIENDRSKLDGISPNIDLVLHLVGSHHGYCRPFAPVHEDRAPESVTCATHVGDEVGVVRFYAGSNHSLYSVDSKVAERFWALLESFGWHELAWLEAILRLGDHRASERESQ